MNRKLKIIPIVIFLMIAVITGITISTKGHVKINQGQMYVLQSAGDSLMIDGRHMGNVNLKKFTTLAQKLPESAFMNYQQNNDSIFFVIKPGKERYFYGADAAAEWLNIYQNIPIRIVEDGFIAKINTIDSIDYVYIPYQILACVAHHVNSRIGGNSLRNTMVYSDSTTTIRSKEVLPPENSSIGKKIQVEGYVLKNVTDILSHYTDLNRYQQMEVLWRYVKNHWNYINDPETETDTWRSASETIENYYFVDGRCYSGDCDDFAILMASFAKQIGYESRLVTAFKGETGHAYAEFRDPEIKGSWNSLDWNSDRFCGEPFKGVIYRIYTDL